MGTIIMLNIKEIIILEIAVMLHIKYDCISFVI